MFSPMKARRLGRLLGGLALVFLLLPGTEAAAQEACEESLAQADDHYTFGRFDQAIAQLDRCLNDPTSTTEQRQRAYRLLALSHLGQDEPDAARDAVRELLTLQPNYRPDPEQDPPPFIEMLEQVKREMRRTPPAATDAADGGQRRGISRWVWIGGGAVLAGVAAVLLLSGSSGDGGGNGGGGPTTLAEVEPNNGPTQAQVIRGTPPVTVNGRADVTDTTDLGRPLDDGTIDDFEDWYRVTLSAPGLRLTLSGLQADCDLYLIDPNSLNFIGVSDNGGVQSEVINISTLSVGTYLIAVSIFDPDPQGPGSTPYTLTIDGAVSGSQLHAARKQMQAPGGADQAGTFRLVARADAEGLPLSVALPDPAEMPWTAYHEAGAGVVSYDATDAFLFRSGRGFWVQSEAPMPAPAASALAPGDDVDVPLHPGWNIIANPFDAPLDWSRVQERFGLTQALWRWDGHFEPAEAMAPSRRGEAYYFFNAAGLASLHLSPAMEAAAPARRALPTLTLSAYREGRRSSSVWIGLAPEASVGLDGYDQLAPPGPFEAARLRLTRTLSRERRLELAAEYRPPEADGQRFDVLLEAPAHAAITLRAEGLEGFAGYTVSLIDPERGLAYDLRRQPVVTQGPGTEQRPLQLLIGSAGFVTAARDALAPALPVLDNYPNPFNPSTMLTYTVPREASRVRLAVFDVAGRRVRLLVDGVQAPGTYEAAWDGTEAGGAPVASGVYLARLHVGTAVQVRRMLLVK